ncbi:hypothetical protein [Gaoshiqia sp. Z1-71]|uniref:glucuronyl esterase domain-containing protein n=1 Tax=Gaoshiqia hydrogeniformans TaxID=3290090 RepID=UPI003BF8CBD0
MNKLITLIFLFASTLAIAQSPEVNYDEAKVPEYKLPPILETKNGVKIKRVSQWEKKRKPELLQLFEQEVYGKIPGKLEITEVRIFEDSAEALNGKAIRKQVDLVFKKNNRELTIGLLIYRPVNQEKVPVFLAYNFLGNHTILNDPNIRLTESWVRDNPSLGIVHNQVTEQSRGVKESRWPVEMMIDAGFGLATAYYGDVDPDRDLFTDGIHPLFYADGQTRPRPNEWASIAAWAWGLSRIMDYLETEDEVNSDEVIVLGHSRLGKTALWAAASDPRFAMCISNNSGCMGAALSRRKFGETIAAINAKIPHWFNGNFKKYSDYEEELPVDQHQLLALIAPRPLYIASATEDLWADPKGEFLSAKLASAVYELYGLEGLPAGQMPDPDKPIWGTVGYHIRTGPHDITPFDWQQYLHFAKEQLEK